MTYATLRQLPDGSQIVTANHVWPVDPACPGHGLALLERAAAGDASGMPIPTLPDGTFDVPGQPVAALESGVLLVNLDLTDAARAALGIEGDTLAGQRGVDEGGALSFDLRRAAHAA